LLISCVVALGGQPEARAEKPLKAEWLYLGEEPPGPSPKIFAARLISGAGYRLHGPLVIRPDERKICWSVIPPAVMSMSLVDSTWSDAAPMPLEGRGVHAPAFLADGTRLYYQCAMAGGFGSLDIWWKDRTIEGWSAPANIGRLC